MREATHVLLGLLLFSAGCGSASSGVDDTAGASGAVASTGGTTSIAGSTSSSGTANLAGTTSNDAGAGTTSAGASSAGASSGGATGDGGASALAGGSNGTGGAIAGGSSGGSGAGSTDGLPCDVSALLNKYCATCHGPTPLAGAPRMLTYDNLNAMAKSVPTQKIGALSVTRMADGSMPLKPLPAPSAAEQATYKSWVDSGMPMTSCGTPPPPVNDPYNTPVKCSSGSTWTGGNKGSASMHPGGACISCHSMRNGPRFAIAGTVFPSAHEPDDCNGTSKTSAGALSVLITEANGKTHTLAVNGVGNFSYAGTLTTPYKAEVMAGSGVRLMVHTQTSGDCNGCHTETGTTTLSGTDRAPGRIMAP